MIARLASVSDRTDALHNALKLQLEKLIARPDWFTAAGPELLSFLRSPATFFALQQLAGDNNVSAGLIPHLDRASRR